MMKKILILVVLLVLLVGCASMPKMPPFIDSINAEFGRPPAITHMDAVTLKWTYEGQIYVMDMVFVDGQWAVIRTYIQEPDLVPVK